VRMCELGAKREREGRVRAMAGATVFESLAEPIRDLLGQSGIGEPTPPQIEAIPLVLQGENVLVVAPTGSGKTEAAILPLLSNLIRAGPSRHGISLLYITPLRALNRDMLRRLEFWCARLSLKLDVRHGDTPQAQRERQSRNPPDVLVTTPETLQAMLPGRRMRASLAGVRAVVVDELHNLVESKRGVQLTVGLQRLRKVAGSYQIVALSATVGSPEVAAKFIFGAERRHHVVKAAAPKQVGYMVEYTTPRPEDAAVSRDAFAGMDMASRLSKMSELIEAHKSTLIFVNSRTTAEMLGEKLNRMRGDVGVHHGSLPREERERVETSFRMGRIRALVCTSTLELGIDIGSVDLVVQYMSPRQVTSLIQRVGRSGHSLQRYSKGVLLTVSADDVLESTAAVAEAMMGKMEETMPYEMSLDVLSHQIAGYLMDYDVVETKTLLSEFRQCYPYRGLDEETLGRVVGYLGELRKLRTVEGGKLSRTRGTREYYFQNLSTIPDETRYFVVDVATNQAVGILGEEFVLLHAKVGLHFILKGRIWQIEKIANDRKIYVTSVEDPLAAVPGWDGEMLPVPFGLAQKTGELRRRVGYLVASSSSPLIPEANPSSQSASLSSSTPIASSQQPIPSPLREVVGQRGWEEAPHHSPSPAVTATMVVMEAASILSKELPVTEAGSRLVADEIAEHLGLGIPLPSDRLILFEGWQKYLIIHSCFGEKVNRLLAYTFEEILSRRGLIRLWYMDGYRLLIELTTDTEDIDLKGLAKDLFGMAPLEFEETYAVAAQRNFPFPARVKQIAERFGALRRGQFIAHPNLCSLPTRFENTPIFEEAIQETGRDMIDMSRVKELLASVARGEVVVETHLSKERPSPIAYSILYRYLEAPELIAPDSLAKTTIEKMKLSIYNTSVELVCMKCGEPQGYATIGQLAEEPRCSRCASGLLTPSFWSSGKVVELLKKKGAATSGAPGAQLNDEERAELAKARRAADLVLSYGRRAVVAQAVYGVGPQTAARILAKMHEDEGTFYRELLDAKLKFIETRPFW
jgi:ATP-dependent Lhr-like helicase